MKRYDIKESKRKTKGQFPYIRYCSLRISKECRITFKTHARRTKVCDKCVEYLKKANMSIGRYHQMTKPELQYDENIEWDSEERTKGKYTYTQDEPLFDPKTNELVGYSKNNVTITASMEDLSANLEIKKEMIAKTEKQIEDKKKQLEKLGKKPALTAEMVRIKNALQELNKNEKITNLENEIKGLEAEWEKQNIFINKRTKTLSTPFKEKNTEQ